VKIKTHAEKQQTIKYDYDDYDDDIDDDDDDIYGVITISKS